MSGMPSALRSGRAGQGPPAPRPTDERSPREDGRGRVHVVEVVGLLAVALCVLYLVSDVIEVVQRRFSTGQLWLTLVAEASVSVFVIGLWLVQRPRIGRVGAVSDGLRLSIVFFTGTVVYALVAGSRDFEQLGAALNPWMTIHGAVMLIAGVGFGYAVNRAGTAPRWTGMALAAGVALIPLSMGLPAAVGLVGVGIRDVAFAGMSVSLLRDRRAHGSRF